MGPFGELFGSSTEDDEANKVECLTKQNRVMGPYPPTLLARALQDWTTLFELLKDTPKIKKPLIWSNIVRILKIPHDAGAFTDRVLKFDPVERPTGAELLEDEWLC